jgi:hypothetical protein
MPGIIRHAFTSGQARPPVAAGSRKTHNGGPIRVVEAQRVDMEQR